MDNEFGKGKTYMSYGEYIKSIERVADVLRRSTAWADVITNQINFVSAFKDKLIPVEVLCSESLIQSAKLIEQSPVLWEIEKSSAVISSSMKTQMEILAKIVSSIYTPQLAELQRSIQMANPMEGMEMFLESISVSFTAAANVSFLKSVYTDVAGVLVLPKGAGTFLKNIKKRTADRLSEDDTIEISLESKQFRNAENTDAMVDVKSMNVIASSMELFSELRECDLIDFINHLAKVPELALEHPIGRVIYDIIQSWDTYIDFDRNEYFHARPMKENGFPYTADEMGSAPNVFAQAGRYNHKNQSHYYFADTLAGAEAEVRMHNPKAKIQVARIKPRRAVKMVDFSDRTTKHNSFLQLIRKPVENMSKPTEYLLPEYVTTCCRRTEIEGIKYYGGREYNNYVTWDDSYFNVELIPLEIA